MITRICHCCAWARTPLPRPTAAEEGFSLVEFMFATLVLLVIAASAFGVLIQTARTADTQGEVQGILDNARIAMETMARIIHQAGNDPLGTGFQAILIPSATQIEVRSDITGSGGATAPDQGDPDGDVSDEGEDVTIRYNAAAGTVELVSGGVTQSIAGNVSAFTMQYFDRTGAVTTDCDKVNRVRITFTLTSPSADPQTRRVFSEQFTSEVHIANRQ